MSAKAKYEVRVYMKYSNTLGGCGCGPGVLKGKSLDGEIRRLLKKTGLKIKGSIFSASPLVDGNPKGGFPTCDKYIRRFALTCPEDFAVFSEAIKAIAKNEVRCVEQGRLIPTFTDKLMIQAKPSKKRVNPSTTKSRKRAGKEVQ